MIRSHSIDLPWRKRAVEAVRASAALELQEKLNAAKTEADAEAARVKAKEETFYFKYVREKIVPTLIAVLAFFGGQISEQFKQNDVDERLAVANRRRLFESIAQDFGVYITQWDRVIVVSRAQTMLSDEIGKMETQRRKLAAALPRHAMPPQSTHDLITTLQRYKDELSLVRDRKERYVKGRDEAKDRLRGSFEQARLFFQSGTVDAIIAFEKFDRAAGAAPPDFDEWRSRATVIFEKMRSEIRNDELQLKPPVNRLFGSRKP